MARFQLISGPERRRRWSEDQKRALVAAAFAPDAIVAEVARRADIYPGQLYRWRQELQGVGAGFAEVVLRFCRILPNEPWITIISPTLSATRVHK